MNFGEALAAIKAGKTGRARWMEREGDVPLPGPRQHLHCQP